MSNKIIALQQESNLLYEKLKRLRSAYIIENDPSSRFKYEKQIEEIEQELHKIEIILANYQDNPTTCISEPYLQVQIILEGSVVGFNEAKRHALISVIAGLLEIEKQSIRILSVTQGSIEIIFQIPTQERLLSTLSDYDNEELKQFIIQHSVKNITILREHEKDKVIDTIITKLVTKQKNLLDELEGDIDRFNDMLIKEREGLKNIHSLQNDLAKSSSYIQESVDLIGKKFFNGIDELCWSKMSNFREKYVQTIHHARNTKELEEACNHRITPYIKEVILRDLEITGNELLKQMLVELDHLLLQEEKHLKDIYWQLKTFDKRIEEKNLIQGTKPIKIHSELHSLLYSFADIRQEKEFGTIVSFLLSFTSIGFLGVALGLYHGVDGWVSFSAIKEETIGKFDKILDGIFEEWRKILTNRIYVISKEYLMVLLHRMESFENNYKNRVQYLQSIHDDKEAHLKELGNIYRELRDIKEHFITLEKPIL